MQIHLLLNSDLVGQTFCVQLFGAKTDNEEGARNTKDPFLGIPKPALWNGNQITIANYCWVALTFLQVNSFGYLIDHPEEVIIVNRFFVRYFPGIPFLWILSRSFSVSPISPPHLTKCCFHLPKFSHNIQFYLRCTPPQAERKIRRQDQQAVTFKTINNSDD